MDVMELEAKWTLDCGGKQDYDADLVSLSTRYWPRGGGFLVLTEQRKWIDNEDRPHILPHAMASILIQGEVVITAEFREETEAAVKAKVEAWVREQFEKIVVAMRVAFPGGFAE